MAKTGEYTEQSMEKYIYKEHIIVSDSTKFKEYQNNIQENKIVRVRKSLKNMGR